MVCYFCALSRPSARVFPPLEILKKIRKDTMDTMTDYATIFAFFSYLHLQSNC